MNNIKNDSSFVESTTQTGLGKLMGLQLGGTSQEVAEGVSAENACNTMYDSGKRVTEVIKNALTKSYGCMNETSTFLQETDQQAMKNISLNP